MRERETDRETGRERKRARISRKGKEDVEESGEGQRCFRKRRKQEMNACAGGRATLW